MWSNVSGVKNKFVAYNIKRLNLKIVNSFGITWKCDHFSKQNAKI
jgi:hypothetical protein